jgi:hypothetical protein
MPEQPADSDRGKHFVVELIVRAILTSTVLALVLGLWLGWGWGIGIGIVTAVLYVRGVRIEESSPTVSSAMNDTASTGQRNHIICLDGTWNLPNVPTNVFKLYRDLEEDSPKQIKRYYPGVGARDLTNARSAFVKRSMAKAIFGGASGRGPYGAPGILRRAYFDFVKAYQPGDRVFIFGFSRGAATVRALANHICKTHGLPGSVKISYVKGRIQQDAVARLEVTEPHKHGTPEVEFLGLWDTVLALGSALPDLELATFDLSIPAGVRRVCHLVAIHERRDIFDAKLVDQDERVEEVWFPGWHSNVGGGSEDSRLSDNALRYMVSRAAKAGARFTKAPAAGETVIDYGLAGDLTKALWDHGPWPLGNHRQIRVQPQEGGALPKIHESAYSFAEVYSLKDDQPALPEAPTLAQKIRGYGE